MKVKQTLFTCIAMMVAGTVNVSAQLKVNSEGKVAIGTTASPRSYLSLNGQGDSCFYVSFNGGKSGISSISLGNGDDVNGGTMIAVQGIAGNGANSKNFGLYGELTGINDGAAIYGRTSTHSINVEGKYAGWFDGDVMVYSDFEAWDNAYVYGNLYVNGYIDAMNLTALANPMEDSSIRFGVPTGISTSTLMSGMMAIPYYKRRTLLITKKGKRL